MKPWNLFIVVTLKIVELHVRLPYHVTLAKHVMYITLIGHVRAAFT